MILDLVKQRSGNFGMMTALMMVPLVGVAGLALDTTDALIAQNDLQAMADAAVLAAVAESSAGMSQAMLMTSDGQISDAVSDSEKVFRAQASTSTNYTLVSADVDVVKSGTQLKAVLTYTAQVPTTMARIFGQNNFAISGSAEAVFQTETFRDFYLLLDNTPSMGLGATTEDIATMVANTSDKCAFACHIVKDGVEDTSSYYYLSKKLGVTIRINVVASATSTLMDTAKSVRKSSNQYRMAVYTFGEKAEDTKLLEIASLTSNLTSIKNKASNIGLMSIPYQNYNNDQQTDFDDSLKQIGSLMGTAGTGSTAADPEKILFFVSDGVGDSYKPSTCTKTTTSGRCQEPIDTTQCTVLKNKGYRIAVLYTTYLPLTNNSWWKKWIKPFQSEIATQMESCASTGLYFEVSPSEGISDAMSALFLKITTTPRLSS